MRDIFADPGGRSRAKSRFYPAFTQQVAAMAKLFGG
jgi:hypothetical protein